ncbi:MAG: hypothetical protein ACYSYL_16765 [Planctomycetota bacterium]
MADEVRVWKAKDGSLHERERDALEVDAHVDRAARVEELVDAEGWNGMCRSDVVRMLLENSDRFRRALS